MHRCKVQQLQEENDALKEELSAWWNWTNSQKKGFAEEQAQASQIELEFQQEMSRLAIENSRLREEVDSTRTRASSSNPRSPGHNKRTARLEPIIERDSEFRNSEDPARISDDPGIGHLGLRSVSRHSETSMPRSSEDQTLAGSGHANGDHTSYDRTSSECTSGDGIIASSASVL